MDGNSNFEFKFLFILKKQLDFQQIVVSITDIISPFSKYVPVDNLMSNMKKLEQIRIMST